MSQALIRNGVEYFSEAELCCPESGIINLAPGFGDKLLELRMIYNKPMHLNSCCRSTVHNAKIGGKSSSYHLCDNGHACCAVDVRIIDSQSRAALMRAALPLGWSVEVRKNYLHLDQRAAYGGTQVVFLFEEA